MKRKRYSEGNCISMFEENQASVPVPDLPLHHGVAENTMGRWKAELNDLEVSKSKPQQKHDRSPGNGRSINRTNGSYKPRRTKLRTSSAFDPMRCHHLGINLHLLDDTSPIQKKRRCGALVEYYRRLASLRRITER